MSDRKSLILPFFFVITFFSVSVITSFPVFVSVFVIAIFLCLRYFLFSVFVSVFVIAFFLCLRYSFFSVFVSVFVIAFFSLSPLFPLFCFRHSATNYQVIQKAEVNNQKKQKIKFSHKR